MAASVRTKSVRDCLHFSMLFKRLCTNNSNMYGMQKRHASVENRPTPLQYCVDLVKKCDYENYLCTLLYPKEFRSSAFAIRALYTELAMVPDVTTDNMRAMIRYQFWKDTIHLIYKSQPPESPVAVSVAKAVQKHKLSKSWFTRILEARVQQLNIDSYRTLKEAEDLGEKIVSSLNYLLLEAAGIKNVDADHACSHLGKCQSLVTLLRGIPYHANRNYVYIPLELLAKHQVSQEQIIRDTRQNLELLSKQGDEKLCDIVYDIACVAKKHLDAAKSLQGKAPKPTAIIMLNSVILDNYLTKLEKTNFNVFNSNLNVRDRHLAITLAKKRFWS